TLAARRRATARRAAQRCRRQASLRQLPPWQGRAHLRCHAGGCRSRSCISGTAAPMSEKRQTLILLRWVLVIALSYLIIYSATASIVGRLIELLRGELCVESEPGCGST